jgi:antitoxin Phd
VRHERQALQQPVTTGVASDMRPTSGRAFTVVRSSTWSAYSCYNLSSLDRKDMAVQRWQLQEAKQQFSQVVELARTNGPQLVTRNGKEAVVVLDADEYRRLTSHGGDFKKFLFEGPRFELEIERSKELPREIDF